jgi:hypothetical protein
MSAGGVVAIVLAVVVAVVSGAVLVALVALRRALSELRASVAQLRDEIGPLIADLSDTVTTAAFEVERVDRIVTAAEAFEDRKDGAFRAFANPVVRVVAAGSGAREAARRLVGRRRPKAVRPPVKRAS